MLRISIKLSFVISERICSRALCSKAWDFGKSFYVKRIQPWYPFQKLSNRPVKVKAQLEVKAHTADIVLRTSVHELKLTCCRPLFGIDGSTLGWTLFSKCFPFGIFILFFFYRLSVPAAIVVFSNEIKKTLTTKSQTHDILYHRRAELRIVLINGILYDYADKYIISYSCRIYCVLLNRSRVYSIYYLSVSACRVTRYIIAVQ